MASLLRGTCVTAEREHTCETQRRPRAASHPTQPSLSLPCSLNVSSVSHGALSPLSPCKSGRGPVSCGTASSGRGRASSTGGRSASAQARSPCPGICCTQTDRSSPLAQPSPFQKMARGAPLRAGAARGKSVSPRTPATRLLHTLEPGTLGYGRTGTRSRGALTPWRMAGRVCYFYTPYFTLLISVLVRFIGSNFGN